MQFIVDMSIGSTNIYHNVRLNEVRGGKIISHHRRICASPELRGESFSRSWGTRGQNVIIFPQHFVRERSVAREWSDRSVLKSQEMPLAP